MPDPQETDTFEIGLVMAGAISAGAYTAGVIDFLYEALDAWEQQKQLDPANTPAHKVSIRVVTGASAGGMTAALIGSTINRRITPVTTPAAEPGSANPFYDAWVSQVDIVKLLSNDDLKTDQVRSVLNADALETLAARVFTGGTPLPQRRPYFAAGVDLLMTVTNVAGVPYAIKMVGHDASHGMRLHKDYLGFRLDAPAPPDPAKPAVAPVPTADLTHPGWTAIRTAALASGAFPIGLAAKAIDRVGGDYAQRLLALPDPAAGTPAYVTPDWDLIASSPYKIGGIDGGMMDNEPLELARQALSGGASLHNPMEAEKAFRAVLMIDPFPDSVRLSAADAAKAVDIDLTDILGGLIPAFKNQARFKLDELQKAVDENIFSRFMIAPVRDGPHRDPRIKPPASNVVSGVSASIACGAIGGFGGFLERRFRDHDYQLGRRNCQQFLRESFVLPADPAAGRVNLVMRHRGTAPRDGMVKVPIDKTGRYLDADEAKAAEADGTELQRIEFLPIIPLMPSVSAEIQQLPWPTVTRDEIKDLLETRIHSRLSEVGKRLIDSTKLNPIKRGLLKVLLQMLDGNIVDFAVKSVIDSLDDNLQLADPLPKPPPAKPASPIGPHGGVGVGGR